MANTPNLDLVKPAGTDHALVSVINSNSDKIDAGVGTLSEQIAPTVIPSDTVANIESALVTIGNSLSKTGDAKNFRFTVSTASGLFVANRDYVGEIRRRGSSRYIVNVYSTETENITGFYNGTAWSWQQLATKSEVDACAPGKVFRKTGATSLTFTLENNSRHYLIVTNSNASRFLRGIVVCNASGGIGFSRNEMFIGENLTVTSSTNTLTITADSGGQTFDVIDFNIYGSAMTME